MPAVKYPRQGFEFPGDACAGEGKRELEARISFNPIIPETNYNICCLLHFVAVEFGWFRRSSVWSWVRQGGAGCAMLEVGMEAQEHPTVPSSATFLAHAEGVEVM